MAFGLRAWPGALGSPYLPAAEADPRPPRRIDQGTAGNRLHISAFSLSPLQEAKPQRENVALGCKDKEAKQQPSRLGLFQALSASCSKTRQLRIVISGPVPKCSQAFEASRDSIRLYQLSCTLPVVRP